MLTLRKIKLFAITILGVAFTAPLCAQYHEVKVDLGGLLFGRMGGAYEYCFGEVWGIQAHYSHLNDGKTLGGLDEQNEQSTGDYFTLEGRYYWWPDWDSDGQYTGVYVRYQDLLTQGTYDDFFSIFQGIDSYSFSSRGWAFGVTGGGKWVTDFGLLIEAYGGLGYYSIFESNEAEEREEEGSFMDRVDVRVGLLLGWRFGS